MPHASAMDIFPGCEQISVAFLEQLRLACIISNEETSAPSFVLMYTSLAGLGTSNVFQKCIKEILG
jgi:hypothetical protein